ncbi:DUF86 domain-containing protein [Bacillus aquiflavi]|uniref:DUF86 domain-containing protein n=1 Tax=Bacillus aquiflavi TaxID=2672567 RepID=A0A6B3VVS3_9BACI|nr:DUF86 domain-containing protein [Bacillus aquiflavi]MBA4536003.1 DUF86 domain-containing protein [Bacillus aquiflavi]NEY80377.1 DUF86 domain-containing protein [Bacillus aquiflavi]UAC47709.1 DUF86 domain-containing protein [Bacillus aquiflavi]
MYFVDREKIEETLQFLNKQISLFEGKSDWNTPLEKASLERLAHTMIEAILDVGNAMIDGFIMRDPGSYEDIIDILTDEKVITEYMSDSLKAIISHRKLLVQQYTDINHELVHHDFLKNLTALKEFSPKVKAYLLNELGPVSAFKN